MARSGSTTLMEVAKRCAVSQSTVSRVLNNSKRGRFSVSAAVRQRILDTAQKMNYRPSVAARNLAASKTNLVAVLGIHGIWPDRVGPSEEAVNALSSAMDAAGYEMCLQLWGERHGRFDLPPLRVDGVVAVGPRTKEELEALEDSGIPYVSVNGEVGDRGSLVAPDDAGGVFMALRHLAELGHRKITYLDHFSVDANHPSVFDRREAFGKAIVELGLEAPPSGMRMLGHNQPWDSIYEPFVRHAVMQGGATAVLAYSHHGAMALLRTARELGLSVPGDFSLICFNNVPALRLFVPSISAVEVPAMRMGQAAAELLLRQMNSDKPLPPTHLKIEERLIARESTVPPPVSDRGRLR